MSPRTRFEAERDDAKALMEELIALRADVVLHGTEAEVDAHDARFARQSRRYERALAALGGLGDATRGSSEPDLSMSGPERHSSDRSQSSQENES